MINVNLPILVNVVGFEKLAFGLEAELMIKTFVLNKQPGNNVIT